MSAGRTHGQQYEFLLYGSVSETNLPTLLHRLRGLCDFATSGGTPFTDREIILKIGELQAGSHAKLHVRQSIDQPSAPWILSYHGQIELGDPSRPTAVRTCVHVGCSQNLLDYLREIGFIASTEIIMKGYIFRKGQIRILVFQIFQPNESGEVDSAQVFSPNYLVELSAIAASGQDGIGNEMKNFAEHLKSYPNDSFNGKDRRNKIGQYINRLTVLSLKVETFPPTFEINPGCYKKKLLL